MLDKALLVKLYVTDKLSMKEMAAQLNCSQNKVHYWMSRHGIERRARNEAIYLIHNPKGDPFKVRPINTIEKAELFGLGLGLYWGEGNKLNKHSVRLGNTDPELINTFVSFLVELYGVDRDMLRFGLQLFTDIDADTALSYWCDKLDVKPSQFYRITVTISGAIGTYRKKSQYGVVTVYYHNKKLRDVLVGLLPR